MGKENRGLKRERSISSSPGREARSHMRRDDSDYRRGRDDGKNSHVHEDRRERDRYVGGRDGDRRRSSPGRAGGDRRESFERQGRRPPSPVERHPDSRREESVRTGERRDSYGVVRDARPAERRDSYGGSRDARPAERRDSYGGARDARTTERRDSFGARSGGRDDRRDSIGDSRGGSDRSGDPRSYPDDRRHDSHQTYSRDISRDSHSYSRQTEPNRDMHGHPGSRMDNRGSGGRYEDTQHRQGPSAPQRDGAGSGGGQPRTYAEYKAMKAAKAAAAAGR